MAVTLNIQISDAEQTKLMELLDILAPGKTPAEAKTLLEEHAKKLLYNDIKGRISAHREREARLAQQTAREEEDAVLEAPGGLFITGDGPPPSPVIPSPVSLTS